MTEKIQANIFTFRNNRWNPDSDTVLTTVEELRVLGQHLSDEDLDEVSPYLYGYQHMNFNN